MTSETANTSFSFGHLVEGTGDVVFLSPTTLASCGKELIKIWNVTATGLTPSGDLDFHTDGIHRLLVTAQGTLVSCGLDMTTAEHTEKAGRWAFQRSICRTPSPVSAICCNDKQEIFMGQHNGAIRKQSLANASTHSKLAPGLPSAALALHHHPVRGILTSVERDGSLRFWDSATGKAVGKSHAVAPAVSEKEGLGPVGLEWEPKNLTKHPRLAVSSKKEGEVAILEVGTGTEPSTVATLKTKAKATVTLVRWSPNGLYLAAGDDKGDIRVWEMAKFEQVAHYKHEQRLFGLAWATDASALAFLDAKGKLGVWRKPIPSGLKDGAVVELPAEEARVNLFFDDKKADEEEEEEDDWQPTRKKLASKKKKEKEVIDEVDIMDMDEDSLFGDESRYAYQSPPRQTKAARDYDETAMQESFQPGATPQYKDRAYLHWSLEGTILTVEEETSHSVEIVFSDTSRARQPRFTDHYGFMFADLSEVGAVCASPVQQQTGLGKKLIPSTIFFKSFQPWATSGGWNYALPLPEDALGVAVGSSYVAAGTSSQYVRVFSLGGVQKDIFSVPGPIVCLAGTDHLVAVAYHRGPPCGENQCISVMLYDTLNGMCIRQQELCLSPSSTLAWMGFLEGKLLATADSLGTIRALVPGGAGRLINVLRATPAASSSTPHTWVPLLSLPNDDREYFWVIGVSATDAVVVPCTAADRCPVPLPHYKPPVRSMELSMPLIGHEDIDVEERVLRTRVIPTQFVEGRDERMALAVETDKMLITLFHSAITDDKLHRARDLAEQLTLPRALSVATKVAGQAKMGQWFIDWLYERQNAVGKELDAAMEAKAKRTVTSVEDSPPASPVRQRRTLVPVEDMVIEEPKPRRTRKQPAKKAAKKEKPQPLDTTFSSDEEVEEVEPVEVEEVKEAEAPVPAPAPVVKTPKPKNVKIQVLDEPAKKGKVPAMFGAKKAAKPTAAPKKRAPGKKKALVHPFKKAPTAASKSKAEVLAEMDSGSLTGKKRKGSPAENGPAKKAKFKF